jgi:diacylglycerol kinase (ATP)
MTSGDPSTQTLVRSLLRKQLRHAMLVAKVEKDTARLERRKVKLQALEARIADLERSLADPRGEHVRPSDGKSAAKHAQLIFNPSSGSDKGDSATRLAQIVDCLLAHGIQAHIGIKTSGKAARALAREAVRSGLGMVVVAGGDGTIEEVASELVGGSTVLGIVPIGTMNNLARSLGVPLDIDGACALIGMGTTRHIDVGRVFSNSHPDVEYFVEGAGVGLGAVATLAGQALEKRRWGTILRALHKLFEEKHGTIKVQMDDTTIESHSRIVTVSNSPLMGKNLLVAPDAKMDDGLLDVAVYDGLGNSELVAHFVAASKGSPHNLQIYRARHVCITAEQPEVTNSDKDVTAERRVVEIEIVPKALSVVVGNGIGLTVPVDAGPAAPPLHGDPPADGNAESAAAKPATAKPAPAGA